MDKMMMVGLGYGRVFVVLGRESKKLVRREMGGFWYIVIEIMELLFYGCVSKEI